jgi:cysteine desulfuration protein SufE
MSTVSRLPAPLAEVVSDFQEVQGQDKLALLLEFADELPPLPADLEQTAMEPVPECQSPLFLHVDAAILAGPDDFYSDLGLAALISPLRLRGMSAMLARIKRRLRGE